LSAPLVSDEHVKESREFSKRPRGKGMKLLYDVAPEWMYKRVLSAYAFGAAYEMVISRWKKLCSELSRKNWNGFVTG
jgi:hypothetical protein